MTMSKNELLRFNEAKDRAKRFESNYWKAQSEIKELQKELTTARQDSINHKLSMGGYKAQLDRALGWIDCKNGNHPTGEGKDTQTQILVGSELL